MASLDITRRTYQIESWRAIASGVVETASTTFLLLIALQYYDTGAMGKALLAAGSSAGFLLSPLVVTWVTTCGYKASAAAAFVLAIGSAGFLVSACATGSGLFLAGGIIGLAAPSAVVPLITQIYQDNYPNTGRGRMFSRTFMIRIAAAAIFSQVGGFILGEDMKETRGLLLTFSVALGCSSYCLSRCPSQPLDATAGAHPLRGFRFVRGDRIFRRLLLSWMLIGFANLMMYPLRVEYLANPKYHIGLDAAMVALLTGTIPNLSRLLFSPAWGHWFDNVNFLVMRAVLNAGFAIGILLFFTTTHFPTLFIGAIVYGVANAGGDVAWSLWVTKFSPANRVADYMSVHTFLTGLRGVIAPLVAFYGVSRGPISTLVIASLVMIAASIGLLLGELRQSKRFVDKPPGQPG